jgi:hypothetical protein
MKNWRGWVAIGAILMMVVGVFQVLSGIFGLINDQWVVLGYNGYFLVDVTGLAIWYIVIGLVLLFGGLYVVRGARWARVVGTVVASLAIISQLFLLPVHPIWSILLIALYVLALIGFIVMEGPLEVAEEEPVAMVDETAVMPAEKPLIPGDEVMFAQPPAAPPSVAAPVAPEVVAPEPPAAEPPAPQPPVV